MQSASPASSGQRMGVGRIRRNERRKVSQNWKRIEFKERKSCLRKEVQLPPFWVYGEKVKSIFPCKAWEADVFKTQEAVLPSKAGM